MSAIQAKIDYDRKVHIRDAIHEIDLQILHLKEAKFVLGKEDYDEAIWLNQHVLEFQVVLVNKITALKMAG